MSDFKLDADGKLDLSSGDIEIIDGSEATKQRIDLRLTLGEGEWFLDTTKGIPYVTKVPRKGLPDNALRAIFREPVATVPTLGDQPGVKSVDSITMTRDSTTRHTQIDIDCTLEDDTSTTNTVEA